MYAGAGGIWGRKGWLCSPPYCDVVYTNCAAVRERQEGAERVRGEGGREREQDASSVQRAQMERSGGNGGGSGVRRGCAREGYPVRGRGSYKIQFQGCRFNTTHTAQIFHLLSTFRRYVGIHRAVSGLCNGCARSKWSGMYIHVDAANIPRALRDSVSLVCSLAPTLLGLLHVEASLLCVRVHGRA